jgi:hypothetical protein
MPFNNLTEKYHVWILWDINNCNVTQMSGTFIQLYHNMRSLWHLFRHQFVISKRCNSIISHFWEISMTAICQVSQMSEKAMLWYHSCDKVCDASWMSIYDCCWCIHIMIIMAVVYTSTPEFDSPCRNLQLGQQSPSQHVQKKSDVVYRATNSVSNMSPKYHDYFMWWSGRPAEVSYRFRTFLLTIS